VGLGAKPRRWATLTRETRNDIKQVNEDLFFFFFFHKIHSDENVNLTRSVRKTSLVVEVNRSLCAEDDYSRRSQSLSVCGRRL